jgi:hypothetical protein
MIEQKKDSWASPETLDTSQAMTTPTPEGPKRESKQEKAASRPRKASEARNTQRVSAQAARGVASVGEVLRGWLKENKVRERIAASSIFTKWKQIVGEEIGARTRVIEAAAGELVIEVDSSALLNELSTYYRQEILDSLHQTEEFRGIQKLKFRSGSLHGPGPLAEPLAGP